MMWPFGGGDSAKSKASASGWSQSTFMKQQQQQNVASWAELESQLRRQELAFRLG
jgi:hypothetical protein